MDESEKVMREILNETLNSADQNTDTSYEHLYYDSGISPTGGIIKNSTTSTISELPELFIYTENSYKVKKDTLEALKDYKDKKYNFYLWDMKKLIETGKYKIVYEDEALIELIKNLKDPNQPAPAPSNNSSDNSGGGGYSDGNGGGGSQSSTGTNTTTQDTGTSTDKKNTSLESPYSFLDNYNNEKNGDTDGDNGDSIDFDYDKFLASWKVALEVQESLNNFYSGLNNVNTNIALSSGVSSVGDLSGAKACLNGACGCSGTANINGLLDTYKKLNDTYIKVDEENARKFKEWNKIMYPEQFGDSEDEEDSYNQAKALITDLSAKAIDSGYADVDEFVKTLDEEQQKEYEKAKETMSEHKSSTATKYSEDELTSYGYASYDENGTGIEVLRDKTGNYYWRDKNGDIQKAVVKKSGDISVGNGLNRVVIVYDGQEQYISQKEQISNSEKPMTGNGMSQAYEGTSQGLKYSEEEKDSNTQVEAKALITDLSAKAIDSGYASADDFVKTLDEEQQNEYAKAKETLSAYEGTSQGLKEPSQNPSTVPQGNNTVLQNQSTYVAYQGRNIQIVSDGKGGYVGLENGAVLPVRIQKAGNGYMINGAPTNIIN